MYIIRNTQDEYGRYTTFQTWSGEKAPENCFICPDGFKDTFFATGQGGFVNITVDENNVITEMTVNQEAYDAWKADHPDPEPEPEPEPVDDINYDELATAIQEGVNEV